MVQVLPGVPTFAQQLIPQINQAIGSLSQGYQQGVQKRGDQEVLDQIASMDPNTSLAEKVAIFGKLSPEKQKLLTPLYAQAFKEQLGSQRSQAEQQGKMQEQEGLKNSIDYLRENAQEVSRGGYSPVKTFKNVFLPGTKYAKAAEEFDTTGFFATDQLFTHFNKGTISKDKLATIKEDLAPNSRLTKEQNLGRINSLARLANLPEGTTSEKFNKEFARVKKEIEGNERNQKPGLESFYE